MRKNRLVLLEFRLIILLVCVFGIISYTALLGGEAFLYFTVQSAMFTAVFYFLCVIYTHISITKDGVTGTVVFFPRVKAAVMMSSVITMSLYFLLLRGGDEHLLHNRLLHYVLPVMALADHLIFDDIRSFKLYDPFLYLVFPAGYVLFVFVRAEFAGGAERYLYMFLDKDRLGLPAVVFFLLISAGIFILAGYFMYFIGRYFANKKTG